MRHRNFISVLIIIVFAIFLGSIVIVNYNVVADIGGLQNANAESMSTVLMSNVEQLRIVELRFIDGNANDTVKALVENTGPMNARIVMGSVNGVNSTFFDSEPTFIAGYYYGLVTLGLSPKTLVDGGNCSVSLITSSRQYNADDFNI